MHKNLKRKRMLTRTESNDEEVMVTGTIVEWYKRLTRVTGAL